MEKFLIDACILLALANKKDRYNRVAKDFFEAIHNRIEKGENISLFVPIHLMFEVNIKARKKRKLGNREWEPELPFDLPYIQYYPLDRRFLDEVESNDLFQRFDKLPALDAIYAAIAFLEKMTLVTADKKDFKKVDDLIKIRFLM